MWRDSSTPIYKVHWHVQRVLHVSVKAEVVIEHERQGPASVVVNVGPDVAPPTEIACIDMALISIPERKSACLNRPGQTAQLSQSSESCNTEVSGRL